MILYFSATGNSKYVATRIAESIHDTAYSIETLKPDISLRSKEVFGIVTPTYFWELPVIVREYLEKISIQTNENTYVFVVCTYGTTPGTTGNETAHIFKKKGIQLSAKFSVQMPDTWTPMFDLSNVEKVNQKNVKADIELNQVISEIKARKTGNRMKYSVPYPVRYISDMLYYSARTTDHFTVEDSCIGCGLCEKKCPVKAINIENHQPVWIKNRCVMCLRCLHHCPTFSISYGNNTKKHGQYRHPKVKV